MEYKKILIRFLTIASAAVFMGSAAMIFAPVVSAQGETGYSEYVAKVENAASTDNGSSTKQETDAASASEEADNSAGNTEDKARNTDEGNKKKTDKKKEAKKKNTKKKNKKAKEEKEGSDASTALVSDERWETGVYGDAGRLYVKDFSVALYWGSEQWIVDAEDSAAYWEDSGTLIADHHNQGFDVIKTVALGDVCEVRHNDGSCERYVCTEIDPDCHNITEDLVRSDWATTCYGVADLLMYTCNDCWQNVTCVWWTRI